MAVGVIMATNLKKTSKNESGKNVEIAKWRSQYRRRSVENERSENVKMR